MACQRTRRQRRIETAWFGVRDENENLIATIGNIAIGFSGGADVEARLVATVPGTG